MTWNFTHMVSGAWSHPPAKSGSSWNHTSTRYIPPQEEFTCFVCTFSNFWIDIGNDVAHAWCSTHVHLRLSNSWIDVGNDVGWLGRICFAFFMFILLFRIDVAHSPSLVTWANSKANSHVGGKVGRKVLSKIDHLSPLGTLITWVLKPSLHVHPNLGYKVFTHEIEGYYAYFMEDFETSFFNFSKRMMDGGWQFRWDLIEIQHSIHLDEI